MPDCVILLKWPRLCYTGNVGGHYFVTEQGIFQTPGKAWKPEFITLLSRNMGKTKYV